MRNVVPPAILQRRWRRLFRFADELRSSAMTMKAPRLWFATETVDGGYTNNDQVFRRYAVDHSKTCTMVCQYPGYERHRLLARPVMRKRRVILG